MFIFAHKPFAAIECPVLASPANGFISFDLDITAPYSFLTTVTYGCNTGFGLTGGDRTRQCSSSSAGPGVWIEPLLSVKVSLYTFNSPEVYIMHDILQS